MKCKCGGQTYVTTTMKHASGGVLRRRKCFTCGVRFSTLESVLETKKATVPVKPIYTPLEAAKAKAEKVAARRKAEDIQTKRRDRVSMYYIEDDDFDKDKWGI
jgi:transcriptional regulator NrdR family protein